MIYPEKKIFSSGKIIFLTEIRYHNVNNYLQIVKHQKIQRRDKSIYFVKKLNSKGKYQCEGQKTEVVVVEKIRSKSVILGIQKDIKEFMKRL